MKYYKNLVIILIVLIILLSSRGKVENVEYTLMPIYDNIYIIKSRVSSRAPAYNYDIAEYCVNDSMYTIKGTVEINYTDGDSYMIYTPSKYVNSAKAIFYIPRGSVENQGNVYLQ